MRKILLVMSMVFVFASFTNVDNQKIVLKDIDGTLLQSYAVIDKEHQTITFTVDANTTVSSSVINGELKIFLIENGNSNSSVEHTIAYTDAKLVSFDNYFEGNFEVASGEEGVLMSYIRKRGRPIRELM